VAYFIPDFYRGSGETKKPPDSVFAVLDLNSGSPEYETGWPNCRPFCTVQLYHLVGSPTACDS